MTQDTQWARKWPTTRHSVADSLRKGAWYEVTKTKPEEGLLVLEVAARQVPVPAAAVEVRQGMPRRFTVVYRALEELDLPGPGGLPTRAYAVCPVSGTRVPLSGHPEFLECPQCSFYGEIGWWETG